MEVQGCGEGCELSCHECEWEACTIVADHGLTCDVRITSDGDLCLGAQRRHLRPVRPVAHVEASTHAEAAKREPQAKAATKAAAAKAAAAEAAAAEASAPGEAAEAAEGDAPMTAEEVAAAAAAAERAVEERAAAMHRAAELALAALGKGKKRFTKTSIDVERGRQQHANAARGRQQHGLLRRRPPARPAQALPGAGETRWQDSEPGLLRHRRGGGVVRCAIAGGAGGSGGAGCSGAACAAANGRGGAAAGAGGGADAGGDRGPDGLLWREPPARQVQALPGSSASWQQTRAPGLFRHRRGGGA
eukprot:scaffold110825_cov48-Phaeocystis_antarctica.AAC.1